MTTTTATVITQEEPLTLSDELSKTGIPVMKLNTPWSRVLHIHDYFVYLLCDITNAVVARIARNEDQWYGQPTCED